MHLTATLSNLNRFDIFFALPKPEKCTGYAFTYVLLKENVANDVINIVVCLHYWVLVE